MYLNKTVPVVRKSKRKILLRIPSSKLEDNIKIDLKLIGCKIVNWIQAA
jgi:hypothetical protein